MKNLQLSLKTQWFEMTKQGIKKEDYRNITPYWAYRLFNKINRNGVNEIRSIHWWHGYIGRHGKDGNRSFYYFGFRNQESIDYAISEYGLKHFDTNIMTKGYPKSTDKSRIIKLEHKGIEIGYGKPEWGAEPNKLYFIIKHGEIIE